MNKKLWFGFFAVYVVLLALDVLIHQIILDPVYSSEAMKSVWRPDMESKMWIYPMINIFVAFFFTLIFTKGYEGKGIAEGIRYGIYISLLMNIPMAYGSYASYAIPYSLALQWFLYGTLEFIIAGVVLSLIFGMKPTKATT
jgi:hypothetical protein